MVGGLAGALRSRSPLAAMCDNSNGAEVESVWRCWVITSRRSRDRDRPCVARLEQAFRMLVLSADHASYLECHDSIARCIPVVADLADLACLRSTADLRSSVARWGDLDSQKSAQIRCENAAVSGARMWRYALRVLAAMRSTDYAPFAYG